MQMYLMCKLGIHIPHVKQKNINCSWFQHKAIIIQRTLYIYNHIKLDFNLFNFRDTQ